jgi:hypothetical protein
MCALSTEKRQVIKPSQFSNDAPGFRWLIARLEGLCCKKAGGTMMSVKACFLFCLDGHSKEGWS